ncbi:MAG: hypothetical protein WA459_07050 [Stellaceae bacterium]
MSERSYYVYMFSVAGTVRYVGSGKGKRMQSHLREIKKRMKLRETGKTVPARRWYDNLEAAIRTGAEIKYWKVMDGLNGDEAKRCEFAEIAKFPAEQLWNSVLSHHPFVTQEEAAERHRVATAVANRVTVKDPKWKASHTGAMRAVVQDPEWKSNHTSAMQAIVQDPEWRAKQKAGIEARRARKKAEEAAHTANLPGIC